MGGRRQARIQTKTPPTTTKGTELEHQSIEEAQALLSQAEQAQAQIEGRIAELKEQAQPWALAAREREVVEQLLAGKSPGEIQTPAMTSTQLRHAVATLESALAESQAKVSQCRTAVRIAKVNRLQEMLSAAQADFDRASLDLVKHYGRTSALAQELAAYRHVDSMGLVWSQLRLPQAVTPKNTRPFDIVGFTCRSGDEALAMPAARAGATEARAWLREEGIK